jgi:hypothetical protein
VEEKGGGIAKYCTVSFPFPYSLNIHSIGSAQSPLMSTGLHGLILEKTVIFNNNNNINNNNKIHLIQNLLN